MNCLTPPLTNTSPKTNTNVHSIKIQKQTQIQNKCKTNMTRYKTNKNKYKTNTKLIQMQKYIFNLMQIHIKDYEQPPSPSL